MSDRPDLAISGTDARDEREGPKTIGIGCSAGGLQALRTFFAHVPEDCGLTFVVVVHLSPEHESHLADLLQSAVRMPVQQVVATVPLEPDRVYVIPPNANLEAIDTHLRVSPLEENRKDRAPIDHFFRTLARTHDGRSIGVILTGTGSDGALGIKEIKERGGLVVVQDPNEAEYDGMPQSAIATGMVDLILPLAGIADAVLRFARTSPRIRLRDEDGQAGTEQRALLHQVFGVLRARTGRDFSGYKRSTLLRRVWRRMQLNAIEELGDYLDLLRRNPQEAVVLADDVLITVTSFFRDRDVFEVLERDVVPQLFDDKDADDDLRVWSVGCATGEEAYSLAMVLLEEAERRASPPHVHVFASDLHEHSLQRAREGFYPGEIDADVDVHRLRRFFVKEAGGYRIRKEVREAVVFAPHNLLGDPPFSKLDLISCRNVLIYLQREVQRDVIDLFHYALNSGGRLLLGPSETIEKSELFAVLDKKHCIYQKRDVSVPDPRLPVFPLTRTRTGFHIEAARRHDEPLPFDELHERMFSRHGPPSMLVSPDDRIVHLSRGAGRYLVHPGGGITANVLMLVREELRMELRAALLGARERAESVVAKPIPVRFDGDTAEVVLRVHPEREADHRGFVLVMFEESPLPAREGGAVTAGSQDERFHELEAELDRTRQRYQAVIEEYETAQEEMKAANEELQSTNEELRSTMEELETSKEELQSMNEELQTVNQENRHKVEELAQLSSDLQNLLASTDIATLFLDRELRIMRFTPKVTDLFNVRTTDRSRPISDLTHRLGYAELTQDAQAVLQRLVPIEREVSDQGGRWYLTRVLPYRGSGDRIGGVVITFVDITERREAETALRASEERLQLTFRAAEAGAWHVDAATGNIHLDPSAAAILGIGRQELAREEIWPLLHPAERERVADMVDKARQGDGGGGFAQDYRVVRSDGAQRWVHVRGQVFYEKDGEDRRPVRAAGVLLDITERKQFEELLRQIDRRKEEFLATLAHELRNPLATLRNGLAMLGLAGASREHQLATHEMMERQVEQLVHLIDDLVDVNRINRGAIELRRRTVELGPLLRQAVDACRCRQRGERRLEVDAGADAVRVDGDPVRLLQVFTNLVENAVKFTQRDGRIVVALRRDGGSAVVEVRDDGAGIASHQLEWIFESFAQVDPGRSHGGLGLGLALVRRLVEMHGGSVAAVSDGLGKGSTFVVRLPLATAGEAPATAGPGGAPQPHVRNLRILVVDDNVDAAHSLGMLLEGDGNEVRTAFDGEAAMREAEAMRPDIALLDIGLPKVDGYGVATWIRRQDWGKDVVLVALTDWGEAASAERSKQAGIDRHLVKPVEIAALERILAELQAQRVQRSQRPLPR